MIYVLMACAFMSSSGEVCSDVAQYTTMAACQTEAAKHPTGGFETYKCEARKKS
mgnify:CR=1 FL=1